MIALFCEGCEKLSTLSELQIVRKAYGVNVDVRYIGIKDAINPANLHKITYNSMLTYTNTYKKLMVTMTSFKTWCNHETGRGHPWYSDSALEYWPTSRVIDPAPGA